MIKRLLAAVFGGPEGKQLKESIMDENPVDVVVKVNGRYPDNVPVSTVPPQVLQTLPKLSEDMEYRFIGDRIDAARRARAPHRRLHRQCAAEVD